MSHADLTACAAYRSRHRLPAVTYCHASSKCVIARSAQPLAGVAHVTSDKDVELLYHMRLASLGYNDDNCR